MKYDAQGGAKSEGQRPLLKERPCKQPMEITIWHSNNRKKGNTTSTSYSTIGDTPHNNVSFSVSCTFDLLSRNVKLLCCIMAPLAHLHFCLHLFFTLHCLLIWICGHFAILIICLCMNCLALL